MNIDEYLHFANDNPVCFLATSENDQPHVRTVMLYTANRNGFFFGTLSPKKLSKQLHKNPKVEICFYNSPYDFAHAKQMRLTGTVEFVDDPELIHSIHEDHLFMDEIVGKDLESISEVFKIKGGNMHFWTMGDVMNEEHLEHLVF